MWLRSPRCSDSRYGRIEIYLTRMAEGHAGVDFQPVKRIGSVDSYGLCHKSGFEERTFRA